MADRGQLSLQVLAAASLLFRRCKKKRNRKRCIWVREVFQTRDKDGDFQSLIPMLRLTWEMRRDPLFVETFRLTPIQFDYLLSLIEPVIQRQDTNMRSSISAKERLYMTLRYLASGDLYRSISLSFRVGKSTVAEIIPSVCEAIWTVLQPLYLQPPTHAAMIQCAEEYFHCWNFPNCCGAIDGKHIILVAPPNAGSTFFNYKGTHIIVLMAACDAQYRFTHVDIGNYGRISDGGVFCASALGKELLYNDKFCPAPTEVPEHGVLPHIFVADDAFPLKPNIMKPYPGKNLTHDKRIFNYRLSRARRCIENAFGIAAGRWRVLRKPMHVLPENATSIVKATVCLHNFLMTKNGEMRTKFYCPHSFADYTDCENVIHDGEWRLSGLGNGFENLHQQCSNRSSLTAVAVRESFREYFNGKGAVSWQDKRV